MKIYKIIADLPDGRFMVYIGSTGEDLNLRLAKHKSNYKSYLNGLSNFVTSFNLLQKSWYEIVLVEDLGNCSREYMLDKENYYINYYKSLSDEYMIVNNRKPNGFDFDKRKQRETKYKNYYKDYNKKYYQKNKDYFKNYYSN